MTAEAGIQQAAEIPQPWVPNDATFGARLALIRQRMGWGNVKKAAEECRLPVQSWRTWERDGVIPRNVLTISMGIAGKTGCDFLWLVHGPDRGATIRSTSYVPGARLVAAVGQMATRRQSTGHTTTRAVRQTRPIVGASTRPLTPNAL